MARLPARVKVTVLCYRRAGPDEILVVPREARRVVQWVAPSVEADAGQPPRDAALRLARGLVHGEPAGDLDLGGEATYRVGDGPRAGEWTERFHAVEFAPARLASEGKWLTHYEAKALAGADAPRVRDAVTRLRELAKLKP